MDDLISCDNCLLHQLRFYHNNKPCFRFCAACWEHLSNENICEEAQRKWLKKGYATFKDFNDHPWRRGITTWMEITVLRQLMA